MTEAIGFIGLGVMGEPICRNLLRKGGRKVLAFDLAADPLARIVADGAIAATSVADVVGGSDVIFLCLPSAKHVLSAFEGGILPAIRPGQTVVDLGTSEVGMTREFARQLAEKEPSGSTHQSRARARRRRMAHSV